MEKSTHFDIFSVFEQSFMHKMTPTINDFLIPSESPIRRVSIRQAQNHQPVESRDGQKRIVLVCNQPIDFEKRSAIRKERLVRNAVDSPGFNGFDI